MARWPIGGPALLLAILLVFGCGSEPAPLAARAGSTFSFALSGEKLAGEGTAPNMEAFDIGFGSSVFAQSGILDRQRGEVQFYLVKQSPPGEYLLETQLIGRAHADRASDIGIANRAEEAIFGFNVGISQVLALIYIPDATPQGDDYTLKARKILDDGVNPPELLGELGINRSFEVIESAGLPPPHERTPTLGYLGNNPNEEDVAAELAKIYPHPKLLITLPGDGTPQFPYPSAASLVIDLPDGDHALDSVLDVFEEQHLGQESIVTWAGGPPFVGFIVINFLSRESDPDAPVTQLAVAFEPGAAYTRIEPEDIATHWAVLPLDPFVGVVETEYFDEEGNEIDYTGAQNPVATLGPIR